MAGGVAASGAMAGGVAASGAMAGGVAAPGWACGGGLCCLRCLVGDAGSFWLARPAALTRRPGLVATLMLTFLFTDVDGSVAMVQWPVGVWLRDLGLYRLRCAGRPEQIFQLQGKGVPAGVRCGRWATRSC
jgi:hypothetical protein